MMNIVNRDLIQGKIKTSDESIHIPDNLSLSIPIALLTKDKTKAIDRLEFVTKENERFFCAAVDPDVAIEVIDEMRRLYAFTPRPMSSRLPIGYQLIPQQIRMIVARILGKRALRHTELKYPAFPLDLSVDFLTDLIISNGKGSNRGELCPVLLTHDIDNKPALKNLEKMLAIEELHQVRSTNFIVPFKWRLDDKYLVELLSAGFELGIHGFNHNNKTPFLSTEAIRKRFEDTKPIIEKFHMKGYRAPSLLRTPSLLRAVADYFKYDSSIPTSGGYFPTVNNGCSSSRIFRIESVLEIPVSLPRDGSLLFMGYKPADILAAWINCAEKIAESGGIVTLLTHSDKVFSGSPEMLSIYEGFISYVRNSGKFAFFTCSELLERGTTQ